MASEFGKHHRQLVTDPNAGSVVGAPSQDATTNLNLSPKSTTRFEDNSIQAGEDGLTNALIKAAGTVGLGIAGIAEERSLIAQENKAAGIKGEAQFTQSVLGELFTGKRSQRVTQQGQAVESMQAFANNELQNMNSQVEVTSEEYQKGLQERFLESTKEFKHDSETQNMMLQTYRKQSQRMIAQQSRLHQDHLAQKDMNLWAQTSMNNLHALGSIVGDQEEQMSAAMDIEEHFMNPGQHMSPQGHLTLQAGSVVDALQKGDDTYLEIAEQNNIAFTPAQQDQIESAKWGYVQKQSNDYINNQMNMKNTLTTGDLQEGQVAIDLFQDMYPQWNGRSQAYATLNKNVQHREQLEREHNTRVGQVSGGTQASGTGAQRKAAVNDWFMQDMNSTQQSIANDPSQGISAEAQRDYIVNSTARWINNWSANDKPIDQVTREISNTIDVLNRDVEHITDQDDLGGSLRMIRELNDKNPKLLAKSFPSEKDYKAAVYTAERYRYGEGKPQDIKREYDRLNSAPKSTVVPSKADMQMQVDTMTDNIIDNEQTWFWEGNDLDGRSDLTSRLSTLYPDQLTIANGDVDEAMRNTQAIVRQEASLVNDKLVLGGKQMERSIEQMGYNANMQEYTDTINESPQFMNYLRETHNFDKELDFNDQGGLFIQASAPGQYTINGVDQNGVNKSVTLPLMDAKQFNDMKINSQYTDKNGVKEFMVSASLAMGGLFLSPDVAAYEVNMMDRDGSNHRGYSQEEITQLREIAAPALQAQNQTQSTPTGRLSSDALNILIDVESGPDKENSINGVDIGGQNANSVLGGMFEDKFGHREISKLTIGQVVDTQTEYIENYNEDRGDKPYASSALGVGQFVSTTLSTYAEKAGLSRDDTFSADNQLRVVEAILKHKRKKVANWLNSDATTVPDDVVKELGKEWEAFAKDPEKGREFLLALRK